MTIQTSTEAVKKWRLENPERNAGHRQKEVERGKLPEVKAAVNARKRKYRADHPELIERRRQQRLKSLMKPGTRERYYNNSRVTIAANPWISLLAKAKVRARASGLEYSLTKAWAIAEWTGRCKLTSIPFDICKGKVMPKSPSIDRIESSKGYTPDNCRFVLWAINRFKGADTDMEMREIAWALVAQ